MIATENVDIDLVIDIVKMMTCIACLSYGYSARGSARKRIVKDDYLEDY